MRTCSVPCALALVTLVGAAPDSSRAGRFEVPPQIRSYYDSLLGLAEATAPGPGTRDHRVDECYRRLKGPWYIHFWASS